VIGFTRPRGGRHSVSRFTHLAYTVSLSRCVCHEQDAGDLQAFNAETVWYYAKAGAVSELEIGRELRSPFLDQHQEGFLLCHCAH
jgi:hypothetical protein